MMSSGYLKIKNRIYISYGIIIMLLLSVLLNSIRIYIKTLVFALFHECSHLVTAVLLGYKPNKIKIMVNGFELNLSGAGKRKKFIIYMAGPAFSLALCVLFYKLNKTEALKINFLIFNVNILPALPLDGGRIFYCITQNLKILKKISRICEVILYSLLFLEEGFLWFCPVVFLIHKSANNLPYDIFVNDLVKRLEKEDKI